MKLKLRIIRTNLTIKSMLCLLLMTVAFAGCDTDKDPQFIYPLSYISIDVKSFFEKNLPLLEESKTFFTNEELESDVFYTINNVKEFSNIYEGEKELPYIDFNQYTLIVGKIRMPESYFFVSKQAISRIDTSYTLNLYISPVSEEGSWPSFSTLYYWGIYPKLTNRNIEINKIYGN